MDLSHIGREFRGVPLNERDVHPDPIQQFERWFAEAVNAKVYEPNVMSLATADRIGKPSVRIVYIKEVDDHGFIFYTHYDSRKGRDMADNPFAAGVFYWTDLNREIRIEGPVEKLSSAASDTYFYARARDSRLNAWASRQSRVIEDREALEQRFQAMAKKFPDDVPRPPYWGGYRLRPVLIEFWQGRERRCHDRLQYRLEQNRWRIERLAP